MTCPLCQQRKAKRACPALGRQICSTCCGTKRRKEIPCPDGCIYLASAEAHPAAVVQRQRERDVSLLVGLLEGLSEGQIGLLSRFQDQLGRYRRSAVPALVDADVREAAATLASTLETAARGILYEHRTPSLPAQRLVTLLRELQEEAAARGRLQPGAMALVFRAIEKAVRDAPGVVGGTDTAFLDFVDRLLARRGPAPADAPERAAADGPRIILP